MKSYFYWVTMDKELQYPEVFRKLPPCFGSSSSKTNGFFFTKMIHGEAHHFQWNDDVNNFFRTTADEFEMMRSNGEGFLSQLAWERETMTLLQDFVEQFLYLDEEFCKRHSPDGLLSKFMPLFAKDIAVPFFEEKKKPPPKVNLTIRKRKGGVRDPRKNPRLMKPMNKDFPDSKRITEFMQLLKDEQIIQ
jgi:hypothetical protein